MSLSKELEVWTAQTLCDTGILLSLVAWGLHLARPYFERVLGRLTLRVASDLWWMLYLVARDGALLGAALLGLLTLNLDLMADIKIGLPFVPLGTVALVGALAAKVLWPTEDAPVLHRRMLGLVTLGAWLNGAGYVLVMEAPGAEYAAAQSPAWVWLRSLRSNANPALSTWTFLLACALLGAMALGLTWASLRNPLPKAPAGDA